MLLTYFHDVVDDTSRAMEANLAKNARKPLKMQHQNYRKLLEFETKNASAIVTIASNIVIVCF